MPKDSDRPYHHGNLRQEYLRAAEKALATVGFRDLSLRQLSRDVGVSHAAIRRHFADKAALLDALACTGYERLRDCMIAAAKERRGSFESGVARLGRAYVGFAVEHRALMALMVTMKHEANASAELKTISMQAYAPGVECIARGQTSGAVIAGDAARLSLVVFAALEGLIAISEKGMFRGMSLNDLVDEVIERVILGLRPRD